MDLDAVGTQMMENMGSDNGYGNDDAGYGSDDAQQPDAEPGAAAPAEDDDPLKAALDGAAEPADPAEPAQPAASQ